MLELPLSVSVNSLYDAFFTGGARIVHTGVLTRLQAWGMGTHSVTVHSSLVERDGEVQAMESDRSYQDLVTAGVSVSTHVGNPDLFLSLKEQPLLWLPQPEVPLAVGLHRSDPSIDDGAVANFVRWAKEGLVSKAIACSWATYHAYVSVGVPEDLFTVIPNGVDTGHFFPSEADGARVRGELSIPLEAPLIAWVARFDPVKDPELFFRAANVFLGLVPEGYFLLVGPGMRPGNPEWEEALFELVDGRKRERFIGVGSQSVVRPFYNAADLVVLTSKSEAAPLSILEARASGAVPLTTPVGDAPLMVGDPSLVTSFDPEEVARSWANAYEDEDFLRSEVAVGMEEWTLDATARAYGEVLASLQF